MVVDEQARWKELFEPERLDFMVAQFEDLIVQLERIAGRDFDLGELRRLMEGVNKTHHEQLRANLALCVKILRNFRLMGLLHFRFMGSER